MADDPAILNTQGLQALANRDFAAAAGLFARAAATDPNAPQLWLNLATAHHGAGDAAGERAALERILTLDQRDFVANLRLAELHQHAGDTAAALQRWQAVLAIAQGFPERSGEVAAIIARAQAFVSEHNQRFAQDIDARLSDPRAGHGRSDLRRFDACVDTMLGRRRIFVNECHGMHFPFLPADEFFDRAHFPWFADLEPHTATIRAELEAMVAAKTDFQPYVTMDAGTPANKWSPLDQSLDWSAKFLWRHGKRDEAVCAQCPETARILESLPLQRIAGRAPTIFFSVLKPHTRLPAHSGVSNIRAIIHLPLIVPPGCGFRVGGETREWREGEAFAFDDTIEHEAWNDSDQPRAVLIFDVWNPHLTELERDLLGQFFAAADASGFGGTAIAE